MLQLKQIRWRKYRYANGAFDLRGCFKDDDFTYCIRNWKEVERDMLWRIKKRIVAVPDKIFLFREKLGTCSGFSRPLKFSSIEEAKEKAQQIAHEWVIKKYFVKSGPRTVLFEKKKSKLNIK